MVFSKSENLALSFLTGKLPPRRVTKDVFRLFSFVVKKLEFRVGF